MSATVKPDPQAAEFFAQVLLAQKEDCQCSACEYMRRMGDEMITAFSKPKQKKTTKK